MNNSAIAPSMRRVLQHARRFLAFALIVFALPAGAANYTDLWWNKDESGWGLTLAHHNDKIFGVWYVYDADGKPFWVVMSDGTFSNDGLTFTGALFQWVREDRRGDLGPLPGDRLQPGCRHLPLLGARVGRAQRIDACLERGHRGEEHRHRHDPARG